MSIWPELRYETWKDAYTTLHMWLQIIGKLRLCKAPWINHAWHATFYVTPVGLTTSAFPDNERAISVDVNFSEHQIVIVTSDGTSRSFSLKDESVASFYRRFCEALDELGIHAHYSLLPNEVMHPLSFPRDLIHKGYDEVHTHALWQILVRVDQVMKEFRSHFIGKCSPVHLFWGSFDLAVTRFSGRTAPEHPGGIPNLPDRVVRDAYSHEVSSCGFWPGNEVVPYPAFYSYAYPEPKRFSEYDVRPKEAFYHKDLHEFILPYEAVRASSDPQGMILEFFASTYSAAAELGQWDRASLETSKYLVQARSVAEESFRV